MKTILIIDDDESIRSMFRIKFEKKYHVIEAENGRKGLAVFKSSNPDLVITDIIMPEEEGFKTILDIKKLNQNVAIIAITGMPQIGGLHSLEIAKEFGAVKGFVKPIHLRELEMAIEELI
jgi:DNA-binding NtrC family response regulator